MDPNQNNQQNSNQPPNQRPNQPVNPQTNQQTNPPQPPDQSSPKKNKLMMIIIAVVVLILIAVSGVAGYFIATNNNSETNTEEESAQNISPTPAPDPMADWETFTSESFSIKYPPNYVQDDYQFWEIGTTPSVREGPGVYYTVRIRDNIGNISLEDWVNSNWLSPGEGPMLEEHLIEAVENSESTTINNNEAMLIEHSEDSNFYVLVKGGRNVAVLSCIQYSYSISEICNNAFSTFKFSDSALSNEFPDWQTYNGNGYEIQHPQNANVDGSESTVHISVPDDTPNCLSMGIERIENTDTENILNWIQEDSIADMPDGSRRSQIEGEIQEYDDYDLSGYWYEGGQESENKIVILPRNETIYKITLTAPAAGESYISCGLSELALSTFEFTE